MALKDMIDYIHSDIQKEIEDKINTTRVKNTQSLISYGESLERQHEDKLFHIKTQLQKQEEKLKAEQDFRINSQNLASENEFSDFLLDDLKTNLLDYVSQNQQQYQQVLQSWLKKTAHALDTNHFNIKCSAKDTDMIQKILSELSITAKLDSSSRISAGFIAQTDSGVIVDLCFETLFNERKQQLLNISMQILKENM